VVIDELVVVLGLDPRKFTEGQRDAMAAFKKTKEGAEDFANKVDESSAKMTKGFDVVKAGLIGIVAGIAGGGVISFVERIVQMDAATGRWAKTIGTSVPNLSTWQYMLKQVGGTAEEATSALSAMQDQINNFRAGNGMFDEKTAFLLAKIGGLQGRSGDQVYRDLGAYFRGEISAGRMTTDMAATQLRWLPGMNQGIINTLLGDFDAIEKAAHKSAVADEKSAEAAEKAQAKSATLAQGLERWGLNVIDFLGKKPGDITKDDFKSLNPFGSGGGRSSAGDRESWIRQLASTTGVDPETAMRVARSEGFNKYGGDNGTSFGDFQLHVTPGGSGNAVGDAFRKQTGLDPSDPANERAMDAFALKWAAAHGWGDFHGAARSGIGPWSGITGARGAANSRAGSSSTRTSTSSSEVHIGTITVNAPNATDADGIANEMGGALKRWGITGAANGGLV